MRNNIGLYIKKRRAELGLTQEDLAALIGYKHKSSINKIEDGKVDIPRAKIPLFAKALKVTETELQGYDEDLAHLENVLRPDEFALITAFRSSSYEVKQAILLALGVR